MGVDVLGDEVLVDIRERRRGKSRVYMIEDASFDLSLGLFLFPKVIEFRRPFLDCRQQFPARLLNSFPRGLIDPVLQQQVE